MHCQVIDVRIGMNALEHFHLLFAAPLPFGAGCDKVVLIKLLKQCRNRLIIVSKAGILASEKALGSLPISQVMITGSSVYFMPV